jgi:hypothetical protein
MVVFFCLIFSSPLAEIEVDDDQIDSADSVLLEWIGGDTGAMVDAEFAEF